MAQTKYNDFPKLDDVVIFDLETYDERGVLASPHTIERIVIYYVETNSSHTPNERLLEEKYYNPDLQQVHDSLQAQIRNNPTEENVKSLVQLKKRMEETAKVNRLYYTNARVVMSTTPPIWTEDGKVRKVSSLADKDNKAVPGKFLFYWKPQGMREGTYFIRWDWKPTVNSKVKSAEKIFTLHPSERKINSQYGKFVPREKYNFLMDQYIPQMYRVQTTTNDMTPDVLVRLNRAVAQGFLELDDLAVGLIDLIDPNFAPEGLLPIFANFFNLELKSRSSVAWRNQIKNAIPLYKEKGTFNGLKKALDNAGVKLHRLTNLWQVVSPYTWTDGFVADKDTKDGLLGYLSKRPIDIEEPDFEVCLKTENHGYVVLPKVVIQLQETQVPEPRIAVIWNGSTYETPIELFQGDVVRIRYKYKEIPDGSRTLEEYIRSLPLADQRDESKIKFPLKNWNVKLIEEDDPLFDLLVQERHPFVDPVVFGKIRTTFLYSEKAFNMDTYNGSLFNSTSPCDMDKDFIDSCSGGQSSKFNVYVELDEVNDEKIREIKDTITDYSPFHAILHSLKINHKITDLVLPPIEKIRTNIRQGSSGSQSVDKVECKDAIYCQIKYKDGRVENGRLA